MLELDAETEVTGRTMTTLPELGLAIALDIHGSRREASQELAELLVRSPDVGQALSSLARIQMDMADFHAAVESWERYHRATAGTSETREALAGCYLETEQWAEAEALFRCLLESDPDSQRAQLGLSLSLLSTGQHHEAASVLEKHLECHPAESASRFGLAVAYQMMGRSAEAAALYEGLVDEGSYQAEALGNMVALYHHGKDAGRLMECSILRMALGEPTLAALDGAAYAAYLKGDYADSAQWLERLVQLEPGRGDGWMNLALARTRMGAPEAALLAYDEAIYRQEGLAEAYIQVIHLLAEAGRSGEAIERAEQGITHCPDADEIYNLLAVLLERENRPGEAEEVCRIALGRRPGNAEAWFRFGGLRLAQNDWEEARNAFRRCTELRPEWREARLNLAMAYCEMDQGKEARRELDSLLMAVPDWEAALRVRAVVCLKAGQMKQALTDHQRLIELGKADAEIYYNAGLLAETLLGPEAAIGFYEEAVALRPDLVCALVNLGHTLDAAGRGAEARQAWARARSVAPQPTT